MIYWLKEYAKGYYKQSKIVMCNLFLMILWPTNLNSYLLYFLCIMCTSTLHKTRKTCQNSDRGVFHDLSALLIWNECWSNWVLGRDIVGFHSLFRYQSHPTVKQTRWVPLLFSTMIYVWYHILYHSRNFLTVMHVSG